MGAPLIGLAVRWAVIGVASAIGYELGRIVFERANEDNWITDGFADTMKDLKHTWTGRPNPTKIGQEL